MNLNHAEPQGAPEPRRLIAVRLPTPEPENVSEPDSDVIPDDVVMPPEMGESLGDLAQENAQMMNDFNDWVEAQEEAPEEPLESDIYVSGPPEPEYFTRDCPLPTCEGQARVPKEDDEGDVLGIGMSIQSAVQLEDILTGHLQEHTLADWLSALKYYEGARSAPALPGMSFPEGITPGPVRRDPARAAAVAAMDARLGGKKLNPAQSAEIDNQLRAARAERAARAKEPTAYDLTPAWSADIGDGVVGIKR